jgi:hypothetical protein
MKMLIDKLFLKKKKRNIVKNFHVPFFEDEMRVISFDGIVDMNYQYIDNKSNEWLMKNVNSLHHHGNYWKSKGPKNSENIKNLHFA